MAKSNRNNSDKKNISAQKNFKSKNSKDQTAAGKANKFKGESKQEPVKKYIKTKKEEGKAVHSTNNRKSVTTREIKNGSEELIRLNRYIANAGVCSRRDADKLIEEGSIKVNGQIISELGYKVKRSDVVTYDGRVLKREKLIYILLNKPKDFITTMDDPEERKTVMQLVQNACDERVFPVGRLDRNTTGLLLLTNDGELADKLTHPRNRITKIYQVTLDKGLSDEDYRKVFDGLELEDGPVYVDAIEVISKDRTTIGIEIHEGRNRIVRRIFEHIGYEVVQLDRVVYAGLTKRDLPRGNWRMLNTKEIQQLKNLQKVT